MLLKSAETDARHFCFNVAKCNIFEAMKAQNLKMMCEVIAGHRHQDYDKTVKYSKELKNIAIGDADCTKELLSQIVRRETKEEFDQRVTLTNITTRALWNRCRTPFNKSLRMDNVNINIEKEEKEIQEKYYGDKSLYSFLTEWVHPYSFYDPNAFMLIRILPYNPNLEKAKFTPEIIPSDRVLDFEYSSSQLQRVVFQYGKGFRMYSNGYKESESGKYSEDGRVIIAVVAPENAGSVISYSQELDFDKLVDAGPYTIDSPLIIKIGAGKYSIYEDDPKIVGIQARRIGYILDPSTEGRTCVSPIDPAIPRIKKMIKSMSELDITMAMHVFPQKIVMVEKCRGFQDENNFYHHCRNGVDTTTEKMCLNCHGTGNEPIAKNSMDIITVTMGDNKEDDRDLNNIVNYQRIDIETPKFLDEFISKHEDLCLRDVFPGNDLSHRGAEQTATEIKTDSEHLNDVLIPYVRNVEALFRFAMNIGLQIKDIPTEKQKFSIRYPDDFDIRTLRELIEDYKNSEGLPVSVRKNLRKKISVKLSAASADSDKREAVRIAHEPFVDKSSDDIKYIIAQNLVDIFDKILWANYDKIMTKMEEFYGQDWYRMTHEMRATQIKSEVDSIMKSLNVNAIPE